MDLFPPPPDTEIIDKADPYVQGEVEKMAKGYKWKVKARVKGNDTDELFRIVSQAEKAFADRYSTQEKEIKSSE
jgi:hypothetical protein